MSNHEILQRVIKNEAVLGALTSLAIAAAVALAKEIFDDAG